VIKIKCENHPKTEAVGICTKCGNSFCNSCMIKVKKKNICLSCASDIMKDTEEVSEKIIPYAIQQQQQQSGQNVEEEGKPINSKYTNTVIRIVMWLLAIFLFIFSLVAFSTGSVTSGIIIGLLGIYWLPPVMSKTQELFKKRFGEGLPVWLRILASIILFVIASMLLK